MEGPGRATFWGGLEENGTGQEERMSRLTLVVEATAGTYASLWATETNLALLRSLPSKYLAVSRGAHCGACGFLRGEGHRFTGSQEAVVTVNVN